MAKNNIRSFRYSDEVAKVLEDFNGDSFNQKFENLVLYCFDEVPKREAKIKQLNEEISSRTEMLYSLSSRCSDIQTMIYALQRMQKDIENLSKSPALIQSKLESM